MNGKRPGFLVLFFLCLFPFDSGRSLAAVCIADCDALRKYRHKSHISGYVNCLGINHSGAGYDNPDTASCLKTTYFSFHCKGSRFCILTFIHGLPYNRNLCLSTVNISHLYSFRQNRCYPCLGRDILCECRCNNCIRYGHICDNRQVSSLDITANGKLALFLIVPGRNLIPSHRCFGSRIIAVGYVYSLW